MIRKKRIAYWTVTMVGFVIVWMSGPVAFAQERTTPLASTADLVGILENKPLGATSNGVSAQLDQPTEADLNNLLDQTATVATELKKVDDKRGMIKQQVISWKQRLDQHNANQCLYPEDHPEVCAGYEQERRDLEAERDRLRAAVTENDQQRMALITRLAMLKAQLRVAAMLVYRCHCEGLAPEAGKACWDRCFDRASPRLRSCLDIADLDAFAACLRNAR